MKSQIAVRVGGIAAVWGGVLGLAFTLAGAGGALAQTWPAVLKAPMSSFPQVAISYGSARVSLGRQLW